LMVVFARFRSVRFRSVPFRSVRFIGVDGVTSARWTTRFISRRRFASSSIGFVSSRSFVSIGAKHKSRHPENTRARPVTRRRAAAMTTSSMDAEKIVRALETIDASLARADAYAGVDDVDTQCAIVKSVFIRRALVEHPDKGGDASAFARLYESCA